MPNTQDIRRRIKSVKNTAQITQAMQMVAAAKMTRAQHAALACRPYFQSFSEVIFSSWHDLAESCHPLVQVRPVKKKLTLLITSDKGLCGALNTNLFREVAALDPSVTQFVVSGKKGSSFLARTGMKMLADFSLPETLTLNQTQVLSKFCLDQFMSGAVDEVSVLYSKFFNTLIQKPTLLSILPIFQDMERANSHEMKDQETRFLFEPNPNTVINALLEHYFHITVFQMVLDSRAAEQSARMVAMKNATDNAKSLVQDLTLEYNKARQANITTELLEITTAQMALG